MTAEKVRDLLVRLAHTPTYLTLLLRSKPQSALTKAAHPDEWSAMTIVAHLRAADDILSYRIYAVLVRDTPLLPALEERTWAAVAGYTTMDLFSSLTTFAARRTELVAALQRLPPAAWERTGIHDVTGPFSLWTLVEKLVTHEEEHCQQVAALFTA
ncbi:MAG: DinB family protein [Caldilineaceae bacterium]|nr:DinB family protein [Caldilineaceae bacterium]